MMAPNSAWKLLAVAGLCLSSGLSGVAADGEFRNTQVTRTINLQQPIVRIRTEITAVADSNSPVQKYKFLIPTSKEKNFAFASARCGLESCPMHRDAKAIKQGYLSFTVDLPKALKKGEETKITVRTVFGHQLEPFPKEVGQGDPQLVLYHDQLRIASPYPTASENVKVKFPPGKVESYTPSDKALMKGANLAYGPFTDTPAFAAPEELRIHFTQNRPFITITHSVREIEVSHWGNVAFEEEYDLVHSGAKLKGGFSRIDYTMKGQVGASYDTLTARLPADSRDVYYRDRIGNITTSSLRHSLDSATLELKPRFPIFGGWKTSWYMGYNTPAKSMLESSGNQYRLKVSFLPTLENAFLEELVVKVILPEGAKHVKVNLPVEGVEQGMTKRFTYLDSVLLGRPVVVLQAKNLVKEHGTTLEVTYEFDKIYMLHEPALAISAFFLLFLVGMIAARLDLTIAPRSKKTV